VPVTVHCRLLHLQYGSWIVAFACMLLWWCTSCSFQTLFSAREGKGVVRHCVDREPAITKLWSHYVADETAVQCVRNNMRSLQNATLAHLLHRCGVHLAAHGTAISKALAAACGSLAFETAEHCTTTGHHQHCICDSRLVILR
jgi:hypothetical protein